MQKNLTVRHLAQPGKSDQYPGHGDISYISHNKQLLNNVLLTARNQSFSKPVNYYVNELKTLMKTLFARPGAGICHDRVAEVYDRAVMVFIAIGNYRYAREICYSLIQIFLGWGKKSENNSLLKYVFQPWINLIRIDRLEGNFHAAHNKINALNMAEASILIMDDNQLLTRALCHVIRQDTETGQTISASIAIERVRAYLDAHHYHEIIHYIPSRAIVGVSKHQIIQQEGLMIALANTGKVSDALNVLGNVRSCPDRGVMRIFHLREFELLTTVAGKDVSHKEIINFFKMALNLFNANHVSVKDISSGLHAASIIKHTGYTEHAIKLAYECLAAAERNSDEILKAESLVLLYELVIEAEGKAIIEDIMIDLYFHTQYAQVRRVLLRSFADLGYVETREDVDEFDALYEYLLVVSNNVSIV